jgi:hypothetical protein
VAFEHVIQAAGAQVPGAIQTMIVTDQKTRDNSP